MHILKYIEIIRFPGSKNNSNRGSSFFPQNQKSKEKTNPILGPFPKGKW